MVRIATFLLKIDCFFAKKYVKMMMRYFILLYNTKNNNLGGT